MNETVTYRVPAMHCGHCKAAVTEELSAVELGCFWFTAGWRGTRGRQGRGLSAFTTLCTAREGKVLGMLWVNASTGAVWCHWWHERFGRMAE